MKERIGVRPAIFAILGLLAIIVGVVIELCTLGKALDIIAAIPNFSVCLYSSDVDNYRNA